MKKETTDSKKLKRRIVVTIAITAFAVVAQCVFYIMMSLRVPNMQILFSLSLAFFIMLIIFLVLWTLSAVKKCSRAAVIVTRCYLACIAAGITFFLVLLGLIVSDARTEEADVDCIIVLGAGLRNDAPSLILRLRLNAAVEYLKTREGTPVIVSGGIGPGETITEAEAMFRYLVARGVDENLIWKEETSTRTQENIDFSLELMMERGLDIENLKVAVVTNEFHVYRAKHIAEKAGVDAVGVAAPTPSLYLQIVYFSREAFALAAELVFGQKFW